MAADEIDVRALSRILQEGYGTGAWHGPDLKEALDGVSAELAFWRPAPERHNIAELALHHAYYSRSVRGQIAGGPQEPFVLEGDDWFPLADEGALSWPAILETVETEHARLAGVIADIGAGRLQPALAGDELLNLVLGIASHAIYHAGQMQLIKALRSSAAGAP